MRNLFFDDYLFFTLYLFASLKLADFENGVCASLSVENGAWTFYIKLRILFETEPLAIGRLLPLIRYYHCCAANLLVDAFFLFSERIARQVYQM